MILILHNLKNLGTKNFESLKDMIHQIERKKQNGYRFNTNL